MTRYITPAERVRELVREHGSLRKAAKAVGCSHNALWLISMKGAPVASELAEKMGIQPTSKPQRLDRLTMRKPERKIQKRTAEL